MVNPGLSKRCGMHGALKISDPRSSVTINSIRDELNFHLYKKREPRPWLCALYHCSTVAKIYAQIH